MIGVALTMLSADKAEPMLRWLERNGYDVSYSTGVDSERIPGEILEHQVFLSVGHDEYWSGGRIGTS